MISVNPGFWHSCNKPTISPHVRVDFLLGASGDHVLMDYYPSEKEDFAAADSSKLDTWVFDKVKVSER